MDIKFTDNSKEVSDDIKAALLRGLETCGLVRLLGNYTYECSTVPKTGGERSQGRVQKNFGKFS